MLVKTRCPECKNQSTVSVDPKGYELWRGGELIQIALPSMSNDDRERLMTGICGGCWKKYYTDEPCHQDADRPSGMLVASCR